jgi:glyoxylase-like metal-dependent hydrolase (beta-lactamase superfamily II)
MAPQAKEAPSLNIPTSSSTCQLSIINTTCDIAVPPHYLVEPKIEGHEWLNQPTFSFYIKHEIFGKELLFDLGTRADWWNSVPHINDLISNHIPGFRVKEDVVDILVRGNVNLKSIDAFVLSHWHFDHSGNIDALPKSCNLVVGPGFKEAFLPGYPAKEDSPFHEADFQGREVIEIGFTDDFKIGKFQAKDYFGDGSFYLLNVPGHATGHICGLVRTTPDTFVFLGGDVCHFAGVFRPTEYIPMPDEIPEGTPLHRAIARPCPCSAFMSSHPKGKDARTEPFYAVSTAPGTFYADPPKAMESIRALAEFDADPNVLVAIAHDPTSLDVFDFFPEGTLNEWKIKGWKEKMEFGFVNELPYNGKTVRGVLVDGLYRDGKRVKDLQGNKV